MYKLFVYAYLWKLNLSDGQAYMDFLDKLFLNDSNNDVLLELELCTDVDKSFLRIKRYFDYEIDYFDTDLFGKTLFHELYKISHSEVVSLKLFTTKCYELFNILPLRVDGYEQPFNSLSYIDDMIEYNSLMETKGAIEKMLTFYNR